MGVSTILSAPVVPQNSVRVLVVDDYPPIADLLARILRDDGYSVEVAHNGAECLRVAEDFQPHALIADVLMRGLGGFEIAAIFAERYPKCRVLVVSVDPRLVSDPGPYKVAVKPIPHDVLFEFLANCEPDVEGSSVRDSAPAHTD